MGKGEGMGEGVGEGMGEGQGQGKGESEAAAVCGGCCAVYCICCFLTLGVPCLIFGIVLLVLNLDDLLGNITSTIAYVCIGIGAFMFVLGVIFIVLMCVGIIGSNKKKTGPSDNMNMSNNNTETVETVNVSYRNEAFVGPDDSYPV